MSTVDAGGTWGLRQQLRDLGRANRDLAAENEELRRRVERLAPVDYGQPAEAAAEAAVEVEEPATAEELEQERAARQAVEAELAAEQARLVEEMGLPAGSPLPTAAPEHVRAAQLVEQAQAGARPVLDPGAGLEGWIARNQDRGIPYEQLRAEWEAYGFTQPDEHGSGAPPPSAFRPG